MATPKLTKKDSKSGKSKRVSTSRTTQSTKPALSAETIVDLDSSDSEAAPTKAKVTSISTENAAKKRKIDVAQEERLPKPNGTAIVNGKGKSKDKEQESSSEEGSDEEDDEDEEEETSKARTASDAGSEDSSEEEESSDDGMELDTPQRPQSKSLESSQKSRAVQSEVVAKYVPPGGFERVHLRSAVQSNRITSRLNRSSLKGKQVWHITVPEDVDITTIKNLNPAAIENGATALTTDGGDEYTFRQSRKRDIEGTLVLLPDTEQNEYKPSEVPVSRTLELLQVMDGIEGGLDLEELELDPTKLVAQRTYEKLPPPDQRQGLQVMNVPIGVILPKEAVQFKAPRDIPVRTNGEALPQKKSTEETPEEKAARRAEKAKKKELKAQKKASKSGLR